MPSQLNSASTINIDISPEPIDANTVIFGLAISSFNGSRITTDKSMIISIEGTVIIRSTKRIIRLSHRPPTYAAIAPYVMPIRQTRTIVTTPTSSDMRVPYITRTNTSRPNLSVPNG